MPMQRAEYWDAKRDLALATAEKMGNPLARDAMLEIAEHYRMLAEMTRKLERIQGHPWNKPAA
jgi:hypothetical protein